MLLRRALPFAALVLTCRAQDDTSPECAALGRRVTQAYHEAAQGKATSRKDIESLLAEFYALPTHDRNQVACTLGFTQLRRLVDHVGLRDKARSMCDESIAICTELHGADHPFTVGRWMDKARHLALHGEFATANECLLPHRATLRDIVVRNATARQVAVELELILWENHMQLQEFAAACEIAALHLRELRELRPDCPAQDLAPFIERLAQAEYRAGNLEKAHDLYEDKLALLESEDEPDELELARALQQLAAMRAWMGDHPGAISVMRRAYRIRERLLPEGHRLRALAASGLGSMLCDGDRAEEALPYLEAAVAAFGDETSQDAFEARSSLTMVLTKLDRADEAIRHQSKLLAFAEENLAESDRDLQTIRMQAAASLRVAGRCAESAALSERAIRGLQHQNSEFTIIAQMCRLNAALSYERLGEMSKACAWALEFTERATAALLQQSDALRPAMQRADRLMDMIHLPCSLLHRLPEDAGDDRDAILRAAFRAREAMRGLILRVSRDIARGQAGRGARIDSLRAQLEAATDAIQRHHATGDRNAYDKAVRVKERMERLLRSRQVDGEERGGLDLDAMARALHRRSAGVALVDYRHRLPPSDDPSEWPEQWWTAAFVLTPSGELQFVDLGPQEEIVAAIGGEGPAARKALRRMLLDPILAAAGDVDELFYSGGFVTDGVPLDCLPFDDGALVGSRISVTRVHSLSEIVRGPSERPSMDASFLAVGDIDYAEAEAGSASAFGLRSASGATEEGRPVAFAPLPATAREVSNITALFAASFEGERRTLNGHGATERAVFDSVAGAEYVHIATHGYFEFEDEGQATTEFDSFTPFLHCGLALAGANSGVDASGRDPGILSAEEVQRLDLTDCYLAVLSACDSSAGIGHVGRGTSSLHTAFHGGGARFVLSSLWKVGDANTQMLMGDVYENLWAKGMAPAEALWEARMAARKRGQPFRDWAGWILTGY